MLEEKKPKIESKFAGEAFGVDNVRTVFVSASEDNVKRDDRVILLIGPAGTGKSTLIDCFCNYFYEAKVDENTRFKIADEIFDHTTPMKTIIRYVFNETQLPFRPIVIDTPGIGSASGIQTDEEISVMLSSFLTQSHQVIIHAIGFVLRYNDVRTSPKKERQIKEALSMFPSWTKPNFVPLLSSSNRTGTIPGAIKHLLTNLGLEKNKCFFFNSGSLFDVSKTDGFSGQTRKTYWDLTMSEIDKFFKHVGQLNPQCVAEKLPINAVAYDRASPGETLKMNSNDKISEKQQQLQPESQIHRLSSYTDKENSENQKYMPSTLNDAEKGKVFDNYAKQKTSPAPYHRSEICRKMAEDCLIPNNAMPDEQSDSSTSKNNYTPFATATVSSQNPQRLNSRIYETGATVSTGRSTERVVPIKIVEQKQKLPLMEAGNSTQKEPYDLNEDLAKYDCQTSSGDDIIKRYTYDPYSMTHKEYVYTLPKRWSLRSSNSSVTSPKTANISLTAQPRKPKETIINDIPPENLINKTKNRPETNLHYTHVQSSPPPAYTPPNPEKTLASLAAESTTTKECLPVNRAIEHDNYQPKFVRSAVQRQIVRRSPSKSDSPTESPSGQNNSPTENARSSWTYKAGRQQPIQNQKVLPDNHERSTSAATSYNSPSVEKQPLSPLHIRPSVLKRAFEPHNTENEEVVEQPRFLETNVDDFTPRHCGSAPEYGPSSRTRPSPYQSVNNEASPLIPVFENVYTKTAPLARVENFTPNERMAQYDLPPAYDEMDSSLPIRSQFTAPDVGDNNARIRDPLQESVVPKRVVTSANQVHFVERGQCPPYSEDRRLLLREPPRRATSTPTVKTNKAGQVFLKRCVIVSAILFIVLLVVAILLTFFLS